ncbi:hypothetical protein [Nitrospira moscoviensis]|uniref:Uncharacterized protein n=1 Tax=Nitrospira moscoviensis TaxID=42253 RepID=A0A0K2G8A7_NITMO|nr:hypothetical protein [Nitrospira moscoviensis]ALA57193.1 hypothetical protein NITMOv2_0757 [Nitrospira moscoviensis]
MAQDQLEYLLEAFAADRLTPTERTQLQAAALRDPRLLSALADQQALKEVLQDPALRARLLFELQTGSEARRTRTRWWRHPWMWASIGSTVTAAVAILIGTQLYDDRTGGQLPAVERENSPPTSEALPAPAPTSNQAAPAPHDEATSPPAISTEPAADRPVTRRTPVHPFPEPIVEERVRDDEIRTPTGALRRQESQKASKRTDSSARSMAKPPADHEPARNEPPTVDDDAVPPQPAEPPSPAPQQAARSAPEDPQAAPPQPSSARTLFYSEANPAAPAALHSSGSDQTGGLTEHEPLIHSTPSAPLAIRYSLVIAGPDGTDREVDPEAPVSVSDRPRLAVQTNQDGYLSVIDMPSTSEITITPRTAAKPVRARTTTLFPLAGLITDPAANPTLHLRLTFARRPPGPKDLPSQTPRPPLMERLEPAPGGPAEHAIYAAAPGESAPPMLIVDLALNQRP